MRDDPEDPYCTYPKKGLAIVMQSRKHSLGRLAICCYLVPSKKFWKIKSIWEFNLNIVIMIIIILIITVIIIITITIIK